MSSIVPSTSMTPVRCPAKGCPWGAHGIPDKYTEARAWHLAAHRAEEHGRPLTAEQIAWGEAKGYRLPETQDATPPAPLSPERGTATPDQPLITPSRCPYDCGHEIAEHSEYACADGCDCEWTPTSATTLTTGGPVCTETIARAAGLDIAPGLGELTAMAEQVVRTTANPHGPEADLARAVPLMAACIERLRGALGDAADQVAERDDEIGELSARAAALEQQAAAATEYRVPAPDGTGLIVRRSPLGSGQWAAFEARILGSGRRCWTRDGLQTVKHLAPSETYCWPDAATALAEARKALGAEGGAR